ncbi:MBL fold metallo-hydrolase [Actinospongicola halichondriae]|uniref:MBL fold metallo-hydrolase n=1 Tax=Actinospongicola halichondriae TaxID=3236844 RepID=UPI003D4EA20B
MSLAVTILGCSGTYAGAGGACSGYLLQTDTTNIWLDCGSGSFANLQRHIDLTDLHGIVCSHSHPDHWLELPVAVNAFRYGLDRRTAGIPLFWTAETAAMFTAVSGRPPEPTFVSEIVDEASRVHIGEVAVTFSRTDHPVETLAVRADGDGGSIVYTADTGNAWSLASLGPGIDIAVVEATLDHPETGIQHLTAAQAGAQAREAGVAALVLTHLAPGSDPEARRREAATAFDGPIAVAEIDERYST